EVLSVDVVSWDTFSNPRDTEPVQLFETGPDTGVFTGQIQSRMNNAVAPDGVLQTWNLFGQNGLVEVVLGSTAAYASVLPGIVRIVDAAGADVTSLLPGGTIYLRAEHESPFYDPYSPDSLYVSLRSLSTSEEEFVQLVETGPDTGIFQG